MNAGLLSRFFIIASLYSFFAVAATDPAAWRDSTRDVYIDGKLDRPAQVLVADAPRRIAVLSPHLDEAIVYDTDARVAWRVSKRAFTLTPDRLKAHGVVERGRRTSVVTSTPEGVHSVRSGRNIVVVGPHESKAGPMDVAALRDGFPAWGASAKAYQPDSTAAATLGSVAEPTTVRVVFATWCGDSKLYVPRVLSSIDAAKNPNLEIELVGIGPDFLSPLDFVQENRIINVPTVIVERDGIELGRITETPATRTVEQDLAAIVSGSLPRHEGRWERDAKIASGRYELRTDGRFSGEELWTMYTTPSGGRLLHTLSGNGESEREVWETLDREGRMSFVEVTDRSPSGTRRTRYRRGPSSMSAHSRGSDCGIVDQVVAVPDACAFNASTAVSAAIECDVASDRTIAQYRVDRGSTVGQLEHFTVAAAGMSSVRVGEQRLDARAYHKVTAASSTELLVDERLRIPVHVASSDGTTAQLVSLETFTK